jgi:hypothetical protein
MHRIGMGRINWVCVTSAEHLQENIVPADTTITYILEMG